EGGGGGPRGGLLPCRCGGRGRQAAGATERLAPRGREGRGGPPVRPGPAEPKAAPRGQSGAVWPQGPAPRAGGGQRPPGARAGRGWAADQWADGGGEGP